MDRRTLRMLCPNGHLGFAPIKTASFEIGVATHPDLIVTETRISDFVEFDPACAIKFTVYRERLTGSPGDRDIFGAQQYAPLLDVEIPVG